MLQKRRLMPFIPQQSSLEALSLFKRPKYAPKRSKQTISCSFLLLEEKQVRKYEKNRILAITGAIKPRQTPTNSEKQALSDVLFGSLTLRDIARYHFFRIAMLQLFETRSMPAACRFRSGPARESKLDGSAHCTQERPCIFGTGTKHQSILHS